MAGSFALCVYRGGRARCGGKKETAAPPPSNSLRLGVLGERAAVGKLGMKAAQY